jgi:hypothetical protein
MVEELEASDEGVPPGTVYRRLIFLRNQQFIQTEVRLVLAKAGGKNKKKKKGGKKITGGTTGGTTGATGGGGDVNEAVEEDAATTSTTPITTSTTTTPSTTTPPTPPTPPEVVTMDAEGSKGMRFDTSYLDTHHCSIVVCVALLSATTTTTTTTAAASTTTTTGTTLTTSTPTTSTSATKNCNGLLVGLGGGSLPMALRHFFPSYRQEVVELDPDLLGVARKYFGYKADSNTIDVVGDGMTYMHSKASGIPPPAPPAPTAADADAAAAADADAAAPAAGGTGGTATTTAATATAAATTTTTGVYDYIIIDADSADPSLGLSAPPAAFITPTAIATMHALLCPTGILVVNTVARDRNALKLFVNTLRDAFIPAGGEVYILRPSEDAVNMTILGVASADIVGVVAAALLPVESSGSKAGAGAKAGGKSGGKSGAGTKAGTGGKGTSSTTTTSASSSKRHSVDDLKIAVQSSVQKLLREVRFLLVYLLVFTSLC